MHKPTSDRRATERKQPWPMVRLGEVCNEIKGRIQSSKISVGEYVTTDNMVKDCGGIVQAGYVPSDVGLVEYHKGDVLIANIRPYLKKIWLADHDGGCSSDVVVFRAKTEGLSSEYLYSVLSQDAYFDYVMQKPRGTKMPRGDRDWMKEFRFPLPSLSEQKEIVARLERELAAVEKMKKGFEALAETAKAEFKAELKEVFEEGCSCEKTWDEVFYTTTGKLDSNCAISDGKYPFFTCSKEVLRINEWAFDCEALLLAGNNAAGKYDVKHYVGKFNAYQRTYVLTLKNADWEYKLFQAQLENLLQYLQDKSKGTSTRYLTMGILRTLRFYVPEPFVQREVVARLDGAKAKAEKLEAKAREGVVVCETMRKAILREAFEGG